MSFHPYIRETAWHNTISQLFKSYHKGFYLYSVPIGFLRSFEAILEQGSLFSCDTDCPIQTVVIPIESFLENSVQQTQESVQFDSPL